MTTISSDVSTVAGVLSNISKYKYNPSGIQRVVLQHLKDVSNGAIDIVDPTNPFVFCLEAAAVSTAAFMIESAANTRKQYPSVSQTPEDLYLHMSDKDYIDIFATPASTTFSVMIQKDDLLQKLVYDPETLGRKISIPRNTEFTVAGVTFSLQYAIDIKELLHGGLQITYDTSEISPLQDLPTNVINSEVRNDNNGNDWIYFNFVVQQFKINSSTISISSATGFKEKVVLTDSFHYARVYYKDNSTSKWKEIYTTHTDQVYDAGKPTAVLTLIDNNLTVEIPQIYLNSGLIQGTLRIDIYETKGLLNINLDSYKLDAFTTVFRNIDTANDTVFTAPVATLNILTYSFDKIAGGTASLSYDQLRQRVITNSIGDRQLPITNVQIESSLEKKGYSVVKNIDIVTNRVFLASRALPIPLNPKLITAGASSIETLNISIEKAVTYPGVLNNGLRITLTPDIVYQNNLGIINVVSKQTVDSLLATTPDNIANVVTKANYLYTPFHYVLDSSGSEFELRPYFFDRPVAQTVKFVNQNATTKLQVNTSNYALSRTSGGFKLTVSTKSNAAYQALLDINVQAQLNFIAFGEDTRAYLNGTLAGKTAEGERIFEFNILTSFDVDSKDYLILESFLIFTTDPKKLKTTLTNEFEILYLTDSITELGYLKSGIDDIFGKFISPQFTFGITQEKIKLKFGNSLKTLWARSRSVVSSNNYKKYTVDIPWLYENDVYAPNSVTGSNFSFAANGDIIYALLHAKGSPILDQNNLTTYRYRVGDVMLDLAGNPISEDTAKITRQIDIMFIEGAYFFATDSAAASYRTDIVDTVVSWLTVDLEQMGNSLLEQTRLYFYPKTTMGTINALTDDGLVSAVEANQYFVVDLYVSKSVYQNLELRNSLTKSTISTIDIALKSQTISTSALTSQLRQVYGNDVVSLTITGLGGEKNLAALTVINSGDRCNIRKRLIKLPDDKLIVTEDVTVNFLKYQQ